MKKALWICLLFIAATFSSNAQITTAIELNDHLADITDSLFAHGQRWGKQFNTAYQNGDYASLKPYSKNLENFVDDRIKEVQSMKDIGNSKELRMAMLDFLKFEKRMITEAFRPFEKLSADASEAEVQAQLDVTTKLSELEQAELVKVGDAQEKYGAANDFSIMPAEDEY